jgi:hypothetical protein
MRGVLMAAGRTGEIYRGMLAGLGAHAALLITGVVLRAPGMWVAAVAVTVAGCVEYAYLARAARRHAVAR